MIVTSAQNMPKHRLAFDCPLLFPASVREKYVKLIMPYHAIIHTMMYFWVRPAPPPSIHAYVLLQEILESPRLGILDPPCTATWCLQDRKKTNRRNSRHLKNRQVSFWGDFSMSNHGIRSVLVKDLLFCIV